MIKWGIGEVKEIIKQTEKKQIVTVIMRDGEVKAINYMEINPALKKGEKVIINQTATSLKLGTGGFDFIVPTLNICNNNKKGHIMKLKYTPYQFSVESCEEQTSKYHNIFTEPKFLDGLPVLVGELHSMLPILVTLLRQKEQRSNTKKKKISYIMTDGGALPIALSDHVSKLKDLGWLDNTITIGNAFGGDLEAINIYSGLLAAKYICEADIVIVLMGPGIVGTGTWMGFSGVEQGVIINAISTLKGLPIFITRASGADKRLRHRGISHHSLSTLKYICLEKCIVPYPRYIKEIYPEVYSELFNVVKDKHELEAVSICHEEVKKLLNEYGGSIRTMQKGIDDDRLFFDFVASTAYWLNNLT